MRIFLNRLYLCFKRSFKNPYIYVMAAVLIIMASVYAAVPAKESSAYIPVGIVDLDGTDRSAEIIDSLIETDSVFSFYEIEDEDELYTDLASGKCSTGFIIPEGFTDESLSVYRIPEILLVRTNASTLPLMSGEEVFRKLFPDLARRILIGSIERTDIPLTDDYEQVLSDIFNSYINSNEIYRLQSADGIEYGDLSVKNKIELPVYKFCGFFIFMAALLGVLACLNDSDNRIYLRMSRTERIFMGLILPAVHVVPVAAVSVISCLITGTVFSPLRLIIYCAAVIILAFIVSVLFDLIPGQGRKSRIFSAVLPTYLILSFLFSGVLIDLSGYGPALKLLSMMFPPYFF